MKTPFQLVDLGSSYIRPADAGGVTLALLVTDPRAQTFNISVAKIVTMPTTGVNAGDLWLIENVGTALLTVQSSGGTTITTVKGTKCYARALVATPTTAAHWYISNIGEIISSTVSAVASAGNLVNTTITSITLTPGVWHVHGTLITNRSGSTINAGNQNAAYSLLANGGTPADGTIRGKDYYPMNGAFDITYSDIVWPVNGYSVTISAATTFYLYAKNKYSAGTPTWDAYLEAVRID